MGDFGFQNHQINASAIECEYIQFLIIFLVIQWKSKDIRSFYLSVYRRLSVWSPSISMQEKREIDNLGIPIWQQFHCEVGHFWAYTYPECFDKQTLFEFFTVTWKIHFVPRKELKPKHFGAIIFRTFTED